MKHYLHHSARREPIRRWWLLWQLYGLPRCSQNAYPIDYSVDACHQLIWPWQERTIRNGHPVHLACTFSEDFGNG